MQRHVWLATALRARQINVQSSFFFAIVIDATTYVIRLVLANSFRIKSRFIQFYGY